MNHSQIEQSLKTLIKRHQSNEVAPTDMIEYAIELVVNQQSKHYKYDPESNQIVLRIQSNTG